MQNLLLDCKKDIRNIQNFIAHTNYRLVGAESIGIVVELAFTAFQHILFIYSAVSSSNHVHTVSSSVNVST